MQWQKVTIPIGKGVDESADPRVRAPDVPTKVTNGRFDKAGRITKRRGFRALNILKRSTGTTWSDSPVRGLYSTGRELTMLGRYNLWAADLDNQRWHDRGRIPAVGAVTERVMFHGAYSYHGCDLDFAGLSSGKALGYIGLRVGQDSYDFTAEADRENAVELLAYLPNAKPGTSFAAEDQRVNLTETNQLFAVTAAASNKPHGVRMLHAGTDNLIALWQADIVTVGNPIELYAYRLNASNIGTKPTWTQITGAALYTDLYYSGDNERAYDAIGLRTASYEADVDWLIVWIDDTSQDLNIERFTNGETSDANTAITTHAAYYAVTIHESALSDHAYIVAASAADATHDLYIWKISLSTLATTAGPVLLRSGGTSDFFHNLGICETSTHVVVTYTLEDVTYTDTRKVEAAYVTTALGSAGWNTVAFNVNARSKPFAHNNRAYLWVDTTLGDSAQSSGDYQATELFEHAALLEVPINPAASDAPYTVEAVRAVGTGVPFGSGTGGSDKLDNFRINKWGNGSNVVEFPASSGRFYTAAPSVSLLSDEDNERHRYRTFEVMADFGATITAGSVFEGTLLIGGGLLTWYGGAQTEELGFFTAPTLVDDGTYPTDSTLTHSTTLPNDSYTYQAGSESYDESGTLHRSVPSAPVPHTSSSGDAVKLRVRQQLTNRRVKAGTPGIGRRGSHVFFRAASDGIMRRVSQSTRVVPADETNDPYSDDFYDYGQYLDSGSGVGTGTPVYTASGEIETVCPNGGRLVLVAKERVWVAGGARQDLVQYSKRTTPGTASESRIAPEFNEGFSLLIPSGERCTGLAELDDKVIVFTATRVYAISGRGPADNGTANDFSEMTRIASDTGCLEARSIVSTPMGVMFRGEAGIYMLGRDLSVRFVGGPVEDTTAAYPVITSAVIVPQDNEVRFTCIEGADDGSDAGVIAVYNYDVGQWSIWEVRDSVNALQAFVAATMHGGVYYCVTSAGQVWAELGTAHPYDSAVYTETQAHYDWHSPTGVHPTGTTYVPLIVETGWVAPAQPNGWARVRHAIPLLEQLDTCDIKLSLYHDYNADASHSYTWDAVTLGALPEHPRVQPKFHVVRQKCQAIKVRIEDSEDGNTSTGEGFSIAAITLELGMKRGTVNASAPIQRN